MHIMHDFWFCVWYFGFLSGIASSILVYAHALLELGRNHPDHRSIRQHIISVDPNAPHGHAHWGAWAGTNLQALFLSTQTLPMGTVTGRPGLAQPLTTISLDPNAPSGAHLSLGNWGRIITWTSIRVPLYPARREDSCAQAGRSYFGILVLLILLVLLVRTSEFQ